MSDTTAPSYQIKNDNEPQSRLAIKFKESPLFVIGIGGWCGLVAYGIYKAKTRPANISLAMHLIHTRVIAQTAVIGGVTLGVGYQLSQKMYKHYNQPK